MAATEGPNKIVRKETGNAVLEIEIALGKTEKFVCQFNPTNTAAKDNPKKLVKIKGGNEVLLSDEKEKESIDVHASGELRVKLADEKQTITVQDKNSKNLLEIKAKDGHVRIAVASKITLKCGGIAHIDTNGKKH